MRTTVRIDDDVHEAARALAEAERISLGAALSRLARDGLGGHRRIVEDDGDIPRFDLPRSARPITPTLVEQALED